MLLRRLGPFLLPALSGLLLACCFPRINQGYLAWIAFIPLLWFVAKGASKLQAFMGGLITGTISRFVLLIWIPKVLVHYGEVPVILAWFLYLLLICLLSCYEGVVCFLTRLCVDRGGEGFLLIFPFCWVALEFARNYTPFDGFPWLLAGYSQTSYLPLVQVADMTGVYGVSFLLTWINTALVWLLLHRFKRRAAWPAAAGFLLVIASLLYGHEMVLKWAKPDVAYAAAMLQENLSLDEPEGELSRKFSEGYARMAARVSSGDVSLLILPESPSPLIYQYDTSYRNTLQTLARRFPLGIVFNNISYEQAGGGQPRYFNSAYFLAQNGEELGRYDKIRLVPFGEYVPLKKLFFFVDAISKDVSDFSPGREHLTVEVGGHPVNAIICFEAIFPDLERRFVREGSQLVINLTNDGWYGDSAAPYQHLEMARWRAIENRRYLLRATNSGISAIIGPTGSIKTSTPLLQPAICEGRFAFLRPLTFYTRHGDLFAALCVIIMLGSFVCIYRPHRKDG